MQSRSLLFLVFTVAVTSLAIALEGPRWLAERSKSFRLIALGQALIEHDLRLHSQPAVAEAKRYLDGADVVFSNLEVAIRTEGSGAPTKEGLYFHAAEPEVLDCLAEMGINLLSLSNNHAWDLGTAGILATVKEVTRRGFVHAGTGRSAEEAASPGYLDTPSGKVALVAMASGRFKTEAVASAQHPGVNLLDLKEGAPDPDQAQRNLNSIRSAAQQADYVIVYQHNHYWENDRTQTPPWQQAWARACIDAGASAFVGHGVPLLHGIEIYQGRPIFYSLGSFIFHTKTPVGHYEPEVWETIVADCRFSGDRLTSLTLKPLVLSERGDSEALFYQTRGVPFPATGVDGRRILQRLAQISQGLGTRIHVSDDRAEVVLE